VRFATVLDFQLDPQTAKAIPRTLDTFGRIAAERVREEFTKLLVAPRARIGLELLRETGLLSAFLSELLEGVGQQQDERYSGDVYQPRACTAVGNSSTAIRFGCQSPSSDSMAPPRTR